MAPDRVLLALLGELHPQPSQGVMQPRLDRAHPAADDLCHLALAQALVDTQEQHGPLLGWQMGRPR